MRRAIWTGWFIAGFYALMLLVQALDNWAMLWAMPSANAYCHGNLLAEFSASRKVVCLANWTVDAKGWIFYAQGVLANAVPGRLYLYEVMKVSDVLLFVTGLLCFGFALACLWANIATRAVITAVAALYTLTHGLSRMQARGRA